MAANAATLRNSPVDAGARLRADKMAAGRARTQNLTNLPTANTSLNFQPPAEFPDSLNRDEAFRRTAQANVIRRKIGAAVGLSVGQRETSEETSELDDVAQEYAEREAALLQANQDGLDNRTTSAKRSAMEDLNRGLQKVANELGKAAQKELAPLAVNLGADAAEGVDAAFEDFGLTQFILFIKNCISLVRTFFKPNATEQQNAVQQLKSQMTESFLDTFAPPFTLATMAGISGLLGFIFQLLVIAFALVIFSFFVIFLVGILSVAQNPFTTIVTLFRAAIGF